MTDRRALYQILINLTNNAIKYTPAGFVRIGLESSSLEGVAAVDINVVDSGIGVRVEDRAKLFQAFEQIDA